MKFWTIVGAFFLALIAALAHSACRLGTNRRGSRLAARVSLRELPHRRRIGDKLSAGNTDQRSNYREHRKDENREDGALSPGRRTNIPVVGTHDLSFGRIATGRRLARHGKQKAKELTHSTLKAIYEFAFSCVKSVAIVFRECSGA